MSRKSWGHISMKALFPFQMSGYMVQHLPKLITVLLYVHSMLRMSILQILQKFLIKRYSLSFDHLILQKHRFVFFYINSCAVFSYVLWAVVHIALIEYFGRLHKSNLFLIHVSDGSEVSCCPVALPRFSFFLQWKTDRIIEFLNLSHVLDFHQMNLFL